MQAPAARPPGATCGERPGHPVPHSRLWMVPNGSSGLRKGSGASVQMSEKKQTL